MYKIEQGLKQIDSGEFQLGLDTLWAEIDGGSTEARVALANRFSEVGLHAFAQDQWLYILEQKVGFVQEARFGAFGNAIWMRHYGQAAMLLEQDQDLKAEYETYAADSYRDWCTLNLEAESFCEMVEELLRADLALEQISRDTTSDVLREHLGIGLGLFNIACDLEFNPPGIHGQISVEVPIAGALSVARPAKIAIGSALDRGNNLLTTIAMTIAYFAERGDFDSDDFFLEVTRLGKEVSNKIILLLDGDEISNGTSQGIENVCWSLEQSADNRERFAAFILGGITIDSPLTGDSNGNPSSLESDARHLSDAAFCSGCGTAFSQPRAAFCSNCGSPRL